MAQTEYDLPPNSTQIGFVPVACNPIFWNGKNCVMEKVNFSDPTTGTDASVTADGTAGAASVCVHRTDGSAIAGDGVDGTGIAAPTGGSGIRGWLSGIYSILSAALIAGTKEDSVSVGGLNMTLNTLSTATAAAPLYLKPTAGRLCRIINPSTSATGPTTVVTLINQASGAAVAANTVYSFEGMGAGQVIDLQIPCPLGIGVYATGAMASNLLFTWS